MQTLAIKPSLTDRPTDDRLTNKDSGDPKGRFNPLFNARETRGETGSGLAFCLTLARRSVWQDRLNYAWRQKGKTCAGAPGGAGRALGQGAPNRTRSDHVKVRIYLEYRSRNGLFSGLEAPFSGHDTSPKVMTLHMHAQPATQPDAGKLWWRLAVALAGGAG